MVTAFTEVITTLKTGGYHPALNVMGNECSAAVEKYIRSEQINIQLAPPHNHQVNAAEWDVTTFKEHFIADLAAVDMHCPLHLWDEFLPHVELTLNMLRFSRWNPNRSANQEVYGSFDFNKTPLAPLGGPGIQSLPMPPILHPSRVTLPFLQHVATVFNSQPNPCNFTT